MFNSISQVQIEVLLSGLLCLLSGLSIRLVLSLVKQRWASTYHHTMSYTLLPVITFTITKVISGNIALSLGMIGALSIVRFRNPVKNPFELVMFFALITIGISMSVDVIWGVFLTVVINAVIIASYYFEKLGKMFGLNVFSASFEEGDSNVILEVRSNSEISQLFDSKLLVQYIFDKSTGDFYYRLASRARDDIDLIYSSLENNEKIISIDIRV